MTTKSRVVAALISVFFFPIITIFSNEAKIEAQSSQGCKDVIIIFARGSGQEVGQAEEKHRLFNSLKERLDSIEGADVEYVELENSIVEGDEYHYLAVPVGDINNARHRANLVEGEISWTGRVNHGKYNESVNGGKELLIKYFDRLEDSGYLHSCPYSKFVLSGYSQGAHVIGDTLQDSRLHKHLEKILYVALFGDPKYDGGEKLFGLGSNDAPWYRGTINAYNGYGVYEARRPYVPNAISGRVGSWCSKEDGICSGNVYHAATKQDHFNYPEKAIPQAAAEISLLIRKHIKETRSEQVAGVACGAMKQDIVVAVDLSPTMRRDTNLFKGDPANPNNDRVRQTVDKLFESACDVRIAMIGYGDSDFDGKTVPLLDFTDNRSVLRQKLYSLYRESSANVLIPMNAREAMIDAADSKWRNGAQKAVLVISNAQGTGWPDKDTYSRYSGNFSQDQLTQKVIKTAREEGGVELYYAQVHNRWYNSGLVRKGINANPNYYFATFTESTGGAVLGYNRSLDSWNDINLQSLNRLFADKPVVHAQNIRVKVGRSIVLQAIDTSAGTIEKAKSARNYSGRWYVNCDDVSSYANGAGTLNYIFRKPGSCSGAYISSVRTNFCNYCTGIDTETSHVSSFTIEVLPADYTPPPLPGVIRNPSQILDSGRLTIGWDAPEGYTNDSDELIYIIRDDEGAILGASRDSSFAITDVPDEDVPVLGIEPANESGTGPIISTKDAPLKIIKPAPMPIITDPVVRIPGIHVPTEGDVTVGEGASQEPVIPITEERQPILSDIRETLPVEETKLVIGGVDTSVPLVRQNSPEHGLVSASASNNQVLSALAAQPATIPPRAAVGGSQLVVTTTSVQPEAEHTLVIAFITLLISGLLWWLLIAWRHRKK